jgi:hypothetical protein
MEGRYGFSTWGKSMIGEIACQFNLGALEAVSE